MTKDHNTTEETNFFDAVKNGESEKVRSLVASSPDLLNAFDRTSFGGTPLNVVVFQRDREMIDTLLSLGADPNRKSDWWAGPWNATQSALNAGHLDLAELFLQHGATVGVHEAAGLSRLAELERLLSDSPDRVHELGGDGCTPLHFAASCEVVDLLVEHTADLDARDIDHYSTPAQYLAKNHPGVARYLFKLGAQADIFSATVANDGELVRQLIAEDPACLEKRVDQETFPPGPEHDVHNIMTFTVGMHSTPLHAAASAERLEMIDVLVDAGMDINIRGAYDDATCLHTAAWNDSLAVAQKLITAGADINLPSGKIHNNTPAGWCIVAGSADVFCYLLDEGAKVLDYFARDAQAALDGKFRRYKCVPLDNYQRISDRIRKSD